MQRVYIGNLDDVSGVVLDLLDLFEDLLSLLSDLICPEQLILDQFLLKDVLVLVGLDYGVSLPCGRR